MRAIDHKTSIETAVERGERMHAQLDAYLRGRVTPDEIEAVRRRWTEQWPALQWLTGRGYGKSEAQRVAEAELAAEHERRIAARLARRVAAVAVVPFPLPTADDLVAQQWARALLSVQPGGMTAEQFEEWRTR